MGDVNDLMFGRFALQSGFLTHTQLEEEQRLRLGQSPAAPLADWLVQRGLLSAEQRARLDHLVAHAEDTHTVMEDKPRSQPAGDARAGAADPSVTADAASEPRTLGVSPVPAASPTGRLGKYELLGELGRGGMGIVYRALDTELGRQVALKTIPGCDKDTPGVVERLLREARTAATLDHPAIVPIHDVGMVDGVPYFAMALIRGRTLGEVLRAGGPAGVRERVLLIRAVSQAVAHAHERRIIHRDLKPSNMILDDEGRVHVMDFGLARSLDEGPRLTAPGSMLGTPQYMPPEQINGETDRIGPPCDVYALGVLLYEALTGRLPFDGATVVEVVTQALEQEPPPPRRLNPKVPADVETICLKALEKDPRRRYPDAGAFLGDVERYLDGEAIAARPASFVHRSWRRVRKHRNALVAGVAVLALAFGLGIYAVVIRQRAAAEIRRHVEAGREYVARRLPREARDAFQSVLTLDPGHPEARTAVDWADAELARRAAASQAALEQKIGLVHNVLARWFPLAPTLEKLEAICYHSKLNPVERQNVAAKLWPKVESFMRRTPADPASQATMLAFAGWARRLAGYPDEGVAWMRKAQETDPGLPYGAVLEALACLAEYLQRQPLTPIVVGASGVEFPGTPAESPEMAALRKRMEKLLARAGQTTARGAQIEAEYVTAIAALQALQAGRYEEAERGLSEVLGAAAMDIFKNEILFARAKVRYLLKRFADGVADLREVAEVRRDQEEVYYYLGQLLTAGAIEAAARGGDAAGPFDEALAAYGEALRCSRTPSVVYGFRGIAWRWKGQALAARGEDPRTAYDQAIADFTAALRLDPKEPCPILNRANAWLSKGEAEAARGLDPRESLGHAAADQEAMLKITPSSPLTRMSHGVTFMRLAEVAVCRGEDPRPSLDLAIAELGVALRVSGGRADAYAERAIAWSMKAQAEAKAGGDPGPAWERALAHFAAAAAKDPVQGWQLRAARAEQLERFGRLEEARAEYAVALQAQPEQAQLKAALARVEGRLAGGGSGAGGAAGGAPPALPAWTQAAIAGGRAVAAGDYATARARYEEVLAAVATGGEAERAAAEKSPALRAYLVDAHYQLACAYALAAAGRAAPGKGPAPVPAAPPDTPAWRERAYAELRTLRAMGFADDPYLQIEPALADLQKEEPFKAILHEMAETRR